MRIFILFFVCITLLFGEQKSEANQTKLYKIPETPKPYEEQNVNFEQSLNDSLAHFLEHGGGFDDTQTSFDPASQNLQIRNLNLLYEYENLNLLLQRELVVNSQDLDYSTGLINRFELQNYMFGLNSFVDKKQEQQIYSFGTEFQANRFVKGFANYYVLDEAHDMAKNKAQFGVNVALPNSFIPLDLELSADDERLDYGLTYTPFSIFNFSLTRQEFKDGFTEPYVKFNFGFHLNTYQSLHKQLKKEKNLLQKINRYDFLNDKNF